MTVQQYYASEAFELPSVVFDVATERAEPVEVRFVVTDIEARQVGFHPRFRSDAWTISDGRLVFEATVGPDETVRTLYALDTDDQEIFEHAMERLRIEQVGAPDRGGPSLDLEFGDTVADEQREAATAPAAESTPVEEPSTDGSTGGERAETTAGNGGELLQPQGSERDGAGAIGERARSTDVGVTCAEGAGEGPANQPETPSSEGGESADDTDTGEGEFTEYSRRKPRSLGRGGAQRAVCERARRGVPRQTRPWRTPVDSARAPGRAGYERAERGRRGASCESIGPCERYRGVQRPGRATV